MKFLKKLLIPNGEKEAVIAYESWIVRWQSRHGVYSKDVKPECEVFTSKEGAIKFANQLKEAFALIKHTSGTYIKVEKND